MARGILQRGKAGQEPPQGGPEATWGLDTWQSFPDVASPWQQHGKGAYWQNQFPAYYNQPQLHSAVEWLRPGWYTPTVSAVPTFDQTVYPTPQGAQRFGQPAGQPVGPISAKQSALRVAQQQLAQSGAQAFSWAQNLTGG